MWIDFRPHNQWPDLSDRIAKELGLRLSKTELKTYPNIRVALTEAVILLAKAFPLKKKCFFIKGLNPLLEPSLLWLFKEGYQVQGLDANVLDNPESLKDTLDRETLFLLYAEDDPVLGRRYSTSKVAEAAKSKGVLNICISHRAHTLQTSLPEALDRNDVRIYSFGPNLAITLCGERARLPALVSEHLVPPITSATDLHSIYPQLFEDSASEENLDENKIRDFESREIAGSQKFFSDGGRVWDRAVIYWKDMDGYAVIDRLSKKLDFQLQPPGYDSRLETMSLSRWGGVKTFEFYQNLGWDPKILRGTVIISHSLLDSRLEQLLIEVQESVHKDQFG